MNDHKGIGRFARQNSVTLQEYMEKVVDLKIETVLARLDEMNRAIILAKEDADNAITLAREGVERAVTEAKILLKELMAGFPEQFVRKGDSDVALTEIKSKVEMLATVTNKIDLSSLMPRVEYNIQHQQLSEKIGDAQTDIAEKTEMARRTIEEKTNSIKDNFDLKISALDKKVQDGEVVRSNINGRILGTGAAVVVAVAVIQLIIHYTLK